MIDVHDSATRTRNMKAIRAKNTRPELKLRSLLHRKGFRFKVCPRDVKGQPDIWMPKWNCAIFVHGCFWHAHECSLFKWPKTRQEFWKHKLQSNRERDLEVYKHLVGEGQRVLVVWECAIAGKNSIDEGLLLKLVKTSLVSHLPVGEIDQDGLRFKEP